MCCLIVERVSVRALFPLRSTDPKCLKLPSPSDLKSSITVSYRYLLTCVGDILIYLILSPLILSLVFLPSLSNADSISFKFWNKRYWWDKIMTLYKRWGFVECVCFLPKISSLHGSTKRVSTVVLFQDVSGLNVGRFYTTVTGFSWYYKWMLHNLK